MTGLPVARASSPPPAGIDSALCCPAGGTRRYKLFSVGAVANKLGKAVK